MLVALTPEDDPAAPAADDLIGYALRLGERADDLASRDPLPSVTVTLGELRAQPPGASVVRHRPGGPGRRGVGKHGGDRPS